MRHIITGIAVVAAAFGGLNAHAQQFEFGDYYGRHDYSNGLPSEVHFHTEGTPLAPNPFGYYQHQSSWNPSQAMPRPYAPPQYGHAPQLRSPYYGTPAMPAASPYPHVAPQGHPHANFGPLPPPPPGVAFGHQMRPVPQATRHMNQMPVNGMGKTAVGRQNAPSTTPHNYGHNHPTSDEFELAPLREGDVRAPRPPQPRMNSGGQLPTKTEPNW